MGKALYRKYRPKSLDDIVGQEHITTTLANSLKSNNVSHAYLFTGPRGSGKTSIARILAHEVNGLDYEDDASHLDIIEIDAASNRRIDEIRALREKVHNAPTSVKFKVYIIDEVHMLTKEAFNALLKTLEEPPEHAIFILATTEAHKLPDTIISRCIRFTFRPVGNKKAVDHLEYLAKKEKMDIDEAALELIAQHGSGSFRDSISLLDQLGSQKGKVDIDSARKALGLAPEKAVEELLGVISARDISGIVNTLKSLFSQGYSAPQLSGQLSEKLREKLLSQSKDIDLHQAAALLKSLLNVPASHDPASLLEITLLDSAIDGQPVVPAQSQAPAKKQAATAPKSPPKTQPAAKPEPEPEPKPEPKPEKDEPKQPEPSKKEPEPEAQKQAPAPTPEGEFNKEMWTKVLGELKKERNTLYGIARMAEPRFNEGEIVLVFRFPFHKRRFDDAKNKQIVMEIVKRTTGHDLAINCIVEKDQSAPSNDPIPKEETPPPENDDLKNISDIFGDAQVLE